MSEAPLYAFPEEETPSAGEFEPAAPLAAMADPVRLRLIQRLAHGPCSVRRLSEGLPISRAAVSQHLKLMWRAGLVSYRKHGPLNIYRLEQGPLQHLQAFLAQLNHLAAMGEARWRRRAAWFERV